MTTKPKAPAAQVEPARKAAAIKAAADQKRSQNFQPPAEAHATVHHRHPQHRRVRTEATDGEDSDGDDGSTIRLLTKPQVLDRVGLSFPTIWAMMRAGTFPRARVLGGKSAWLESEIIAWINLLPVRPYKGDSASEAA